MNSCLQNFIPVNKANDEVYECNIKRQKSQMWIFRQ